MHSLTYAALALSNENHPALPVEHQHFGWEALGLLTLAVICRIIWKSLEAQRNWAVDNLLGSVAMVGCFIFGIWGLICLLSWLTSGEPNSGPPG